jgi:hypothetical protein
MGDERRRWFRWQIGWLAGWQEKEGAERSRKKERSWCSLLCLCAYDTSTAIYAYTFSITLTTINLFTSQEIFIAWRRDLFERRSPLRLYGLLQISDKLAHSHPSNTSATIQKPRRCSFMPRGCAMHIPERLRPSFSNEVSKAPYATK